jgi:hypothetical protein
VLCGGEASISQTSWAGGRLLKIELHNVILGRNIRNFSYELAYRSMFCYFLKLYKGNKCEKYYKILIYFVFFSFLNTV